MGLLSSITACSPKLLPMSAAWELTFRSLPSVTLDDQAERFADSNPSKKIESTTGVGVTVGVDVGVGVGEGGGVFVGV